MRTRKIFFYSHDTFGLGHIRRTQKIANAIASDGRSILIACASPKASSFASRPGIEHLNLPGFAKQISGEYVPRNLNIPTDEFVNLRAHLLLSAVRSFSPDAIVIDKEPLGVKKELLPSLEYLRAHRKHCHVVCGFRDILDEKNAVHREWAQRNTEQALRDYFDSILIYGEREIFDFAHEYELPSEIATRLRYTGYIQNGEPLDSDPGTLDDLNFSFANDRPVVTFTLGGGGDGWDFLETFLDAIASSHRLPFNSVVLTGPFASPRVIARARAIADSRPDVKAAVFTANPVSLFRSSRLVISMGGYNTLTELVALRKRPLILPRVNPRCEQLIRAQVFSARGLCDFLHPDQVTPSSLLAKIENMLASSKIEAPPFEANGLARIRAHFEEILR